MATLVLEELPQEFRQRLLNSNRPQPNTHAETSTATPQTATRLTATAATSEEAATRYTLAAAAT